MNKGGAALLLLLVVGCAPTDRESFPDSAATAWCKKKRTCDRGDFDSQWDSISECRDDVSPGIENVLDLLEVVDVFDQCTFSEKLAGQYLADLRQASCEEFTGNTWDDESPNVYECAQ